MSFLSILQNINNAFATGNAIAQPLEPVISVLPGGAAFNAIFNTVIAVESLFAGAVQAGINTNAAKKSVATTIVNTVSPGIPAATLSSAIDGTVTAMNALRDVQTKVTGAASVANAPVQPLTLTPPTPTSTLQPPSPHIIG